MEKSYSDLRENIKEIKLKIQEAAKRGNRDLNHITLMAVTKTVDPDLVNIAIEEGVTLLGESRAQEMNTKISSYSLQNNIEIHFIGALQSNKVRQIIDHVTMIQSVDRMSLVKEIEKQAKRRNIIMDILIQVNVGKEESKSGVYPEDMLEFYSKIKNYNHISVRGIMTIPPNSQNYDETREHFAVLRQILVDLQGENRDNKNIDILSMGMSEDYEIAIEQGANIVRIGSGLFGRRN